MRVYHIDWRAIVPYPTSRSFDSARDFSDTAVGRRVVVTGRAVVRHDLPVFIVPKDGYPPGTGPPAGIPVPEGTDLHEASKRTVIEDAQWRLADEQK